MFRQSGWPRASGAGRRLVLASLLAAMNWSVARGEPRAALSPRTVIYPGDILVDESLNEMADPPVSPGYATAAEGRALLVGKRARKTLLPGRPISIVDVENPRSVVNGSQVRIVYREAGLSILASGLALQNGAAGDTIRVRNVDTGLTVSGVVHADGSVVIGDG